MASTADQTVTEKFHLALRRYEDYVRDSGDFSGRKNTADYQTQLLGLIKEFRIIAIIVSHLGLFSDNEGIDEMAVSYVPFLNVDYYLATLYQNLMVDAQSVGEVQIDGLLHKVENLRSAQDYLASYFVVLSNYSLLNKEQNERFRAYKASENPSIDDILSNQERNPAALRAQKIANFKAEKELSAKVQLLHSRYGFDGEEAQKEFGALDEDSAKKLFLDEVALFALKGFSLLDLISMELAVLKNMPTEPLAPKGPVKESEKKLDDSTGYTTRLEVVPGKKQPISALLSKQGRVLQPFTITSSKQELRQKVFGTGQVLPSMTVEEYLDYELANGKMAATEENNNKDQNDWEDSDEEREKREWDDWKDDNPKGSGNTGANIG